jgi:GT2 family glycosyltransferase
MPPISALMVFYRDTPFLRPAIAAALAQTCRDFELLLVDNGTGLSADALGEMGRDPRLRWVRRPRNEGIVGGHNAGIAAARGEFVALFDSDDLALPHRFERQLAALRADPALGLVSGLADRMDAAGRLSGRREFCLPDAAEHRAYAQYAAPVVTPVAMGRRELFAALPYRAEFSFAGDLDFQARASETTRFAVVPEVLLHYRWHAAQATQQYYGAIEQSRCVIQIATARRRAGRAENLPQAFEHTVAATAAESWRRGAAVCLAENFFVLAAFQARRSFALERSPAALLRATRLAGRAWRQASSAERGNVAKMFLSGPVRALGLHPA